MLILSRRQAEQILFPQLGITVEAQGCELAILVAYTGSSTLVLIRRLIGEVPPLTGLPGPLSSQNRNQPAKNPFRKPIQSNEPVAVGHFPVGIGIQTQTTPGPLIANICLLE